MERLRSVTSWLGGFPFAIATVAIATVVFLPLREVLSGVEVALLFILVIGVVARVGGLWASLAAAALAFVSELFFFVEPYNVLHVGSPRDWMLLAVFLLVGLVSAVQTGTMRDREASALARQLDLTAINRLSARLLTEGAVEGMARTIAHELVTLGVAERVAVYLRCRAGAPELVADAGADAMGRAEEALAGWSCMHSKAVGLPKIAGLAGPERPPSVGPGEALEGTVADGLFVPLQVEGEPGGVLYARAPAEAGPPDPNAVRLLLAVAHLASAFLERDRLRAAAARTEALRESDRLKGTLLSSVSHELKTPLAAVRARITGLLEGDVACETERLGDELRSVEEDLSRLDSSIADLLDLSRLESDAWRATPDEYEVSEVLGSVLARLPREQKDRVVFEVPDDLPTVRVDFAQWVRAIANLLENALTYSPPGSRVGVGARRLADEVLLWVEDNGPGVSDEEKPRVFEKFYRGDASASVPSGTGLGLAITREVARAHGGRAWVEDADPTGSRFYVSVPVAVSGGADGES